jgi:hypothetical protein
MRNGAGWLSWVVRTFALAGGEGSDIVAIVLLREE